MADWSRAFDDPIPLPRRRQLVTLKDAATYIQNFPKAEQLGLKRNCGCENWPPNCRPSERD
jgi:hypothetical protein